MIQKRWPQNNEFQSWVDATISSDEKKKKKVYKGVLSGKNHMMLHTMHDIVLFLTKGYKVY